jgi:putative exosortase-associated protein (TIGR04073 family)
MKTAVILILLSFMVLTVSCSSTNWVEQEDPSYPVKAARMIGRGGANIICSPLELLNQPLCNATGDSLGEWTAGLLTGLGMGLFYTPARCISGIIDVLTFYYPHRALLDPEFISSKEYTLRTED